MSLLPGHLHTLYKSRRGNLEVPFEPARMSPKWVFIFKNPVPLPPPHLKFPLFLGGDQILQASPHLPFSSLLSKSNYGVFIESENAMCPFTSSSSFAACVDMGPDCGQWNAGTSDRGHLRKLALLMEKGKNSLFPCLLDTCLLAGDALGASCPHPFHSVLPLGQAWLCAHS